MFAGSSEAGVDALNPMRRLIGRLGGAARSQWGELRHAAAVVATVIRVGARPASWDGPVRRAFAGQVLVIGVQALGLIVAIGVCAGMLVVVQLSSWVGEAGQSELLGPVLVAVVARELGPVLINLVVIVRSGSAMATELAVLTVQGDNRVLESRGSDPFLNLVLPRVLGMAASTLCLTLVFVLVAFASGYFFAGWMGKGSGDALLFADALSGAVQRKDILGILAKSVVPALFASASCCIGGLGVGGSLSRLPKAIQRSLTRSVAGLFIISAVVSLLTYL